MQRLFKEYDLEIIAESNQKIVNYLDVTLNFKNGTQQHTTKIICGSLDKIRNYHVNPQTVNIKNIVSIREKSYGLIHHLAKIFLQKWVNLF